MKQKTRLRGFLRLESWCPGEDWRSDGPIHLKLLIDKALCSVLVPRCHISSSHIDTGLAMVGWPSVVEAS